MTMAKRQAERDHQRSPPIAEEQQQEDDDENGGFAQRADDGADGTANQPAAIVEDVDGDALRKRGLQFLQALADVTHELAGIGAAQAEHQPLDRFAMAIDRDRAIARQRADLNPRDVADPDRDALAGVDHDRANVVDGTDAALDPDQGAVFALVDAAGAVVAAVGLHRSAKQFRRNAARRQRIVEWYDLEGPNIAAERVDVGHTGDRSKRRADHPIEQRAPLRQRQLGTVDREHEHFAEGARDRRQAAADALGQIAGNVRETFGDLIARPVDVGAVLEIDRDVGERIFG